MGKPSDIRRRRQRPGKRERARAKKRSRGSSSCSVGGAGTYRVKAGRKKYGKVSRYVSRAVEAHLAGDSATSKSGISIKRPLYTIEMGPAPLHRSPWDWPADAVVIEVGPGSVPC
jgi:hypothetical protein